MSILNIVQIPDPILTRPAEVVSAIDSTILKLLDDMADTMYDAPGIGLAAPQIGVSKRIAVIDISEERNSLYELINPTIVWSEGKVDSEEGCLSIPKYRDTITRQRTVRVNYLDRKGESKQLEAQDLLSFCLQHEIDHLDGILFTDHLSRLKREHFKKWLKKHLL